MPGKAAQIINYHIPCKLIGLCAPQSATAGRPGSWSWSMLQTEGRGRGKGEGRGTECIAARHGKFHPAGSGGQTGRPPWHRPTHAKNAHPNRRPNGTRFDAGLDRPRFAFAASLGHSISETDRQADRDRTGLDWTCMDAENFATISSTSSCLLQPVRRHPTSSPPFQRTTEQCCGGRDETVASSPLIRSERASKRTFRPATGGLELALERAPRANRRRRLACRLTPPATLPIPWAVHSSPIPRGPGGWLAVPQ